MSSSWVKQNQKNDDESLEIEITQYRRSWEQNEELGLDRFNFSTINNNNSEEFNTPEEEVNFLVGLIQNSTNIVGLTGAVKY